MRVLRLLVVILALNRPLLAQDNPNIAYVAQIKQQLVDAHIDLSGPCGAFEITKRVAWGKRGEGYGLLGGKTPAQNGCSVGTERYAVDWVLKPDGSGADILVNAETDNTPSWQAGTANPSLFRLAFNPGGIPPPPDPAPTPPDELAPILARLVTVEQAVAELRTRITDFYLRFANHDQRIETLEIIEAHPIWADCRASIFGIPVSCELVTK